VDRRCLVGSGKTSLVVLALMGIVSLDVTQVLLGQLGDGLVDLTKSRTKSNQATKIKFMHKIFFFSSNYLSRDL
jgi:hypothetical protein